MSHPLLDRVRTVGRKVRRLMLLYGCSCVLAVVLSAAMLLAMADYLVRYSDVGARWLSSLAVVGIGCLAGYLFLVPALRFRRSEVQIARMIENRFPKLGDQLSSTVAFLRQPEEEFTSGSAALKRRVIADTAAHVEKLNLSEAVSRRAPFRALGLAVLTCLITAVVFALEPAASTLAARRLLAPWKEEAWPRRNQLTFVDTPRKVAVAADFRVELIDTNDRLPQTVEFEYRFAGEALTTVKPMKLNRVSRRFSYEMTNVDRSLFYRAIGGDHTTAWQELAVVAPAKLDTLEVNVRPPAYSGWKDERTDGHVRALVGSRVAIRARVDQPLSEVRMWFDAGGQPEEIPVQLANDGLSFQVGYETSSPWVIRKSGQYWFELTELEDPIDSSPATFDVRAIVDTPPKILLTAPPKHIYVTPRGIVRLRGSVEDDLGIQRVEVRYWRESEGPGASHSPLVLLPDNNTTSEVSPANRVTQFEVDYRWDLATLRWVEPGSQVEYRLVAFDYKPQSSEMEPRKISVISVEEFVDRIGRRQSNVLQQLADALRVQIEVRTSLGESLLQLSTERDVTPLPLDQIQGAELRQRRVQQILVGSDGGITSELERLGQQLEDNRIEDPRMMQSFAEMLAEIHRIDREHLPPIQRELVLAIEQSRELRTVGDVDPNVVEQLGKNLQQAGEQQEEVIASIERMIGELSQWDSFQRVARDLRYLRQRQQKLTEDTDSHRLATIGKDLAALDPQQRTDLQKLGLRQSVLAREFEKLMGGMSRMQSDLKRTQPQVAEVLGDALETAARLGIGSNLRDAGTAVRENRVSNAVRSQREALDELREMLDVLSDRGAGELGRRIEQLIEAQRDLERQRDEIDALRQQLRAAEEREDSNATEQELRELKKQRVDGQRALAELARRLRRLQAEEAANATAQAAATAGDSGEDPALQKTKDQLDQASRQLEQELNRMRQELAREQMTRLEQRIAGLSAQQLTLMERTRELHGIAEREGALSRSQRLTVIEMSRQQRTLALETNALAANMARSEAFRLGLGGAAREMLRAAGRLGRGDVGTEVQENQQVALRRLEQLILALKQDPAAGQDDPAPSPGELGDLAPEDAVKLMADLKLLKLMQEEVRRRTIEIEAARRESGGALPDPLRQEVKELATEQGRLADLISNLSNPANKPGNSPRPNPVQDDPPVPAPTQEVR